MVIVYPFPIRLRKEVEDHRRDLFNTEGQEHTGRPNKCVEQTA
jgi:hypothetical protein